MLAIFLVRVTLTHVKETDDELPLNATSAFNASTAADDVVSDGAAPASTAGKVNFLSSLVRKRRRRRR